MTILKWTLFVTLLFLPLGLAKIITMLAGGGRKNPSNYEPPDRNRRAEFIHQVDEKYFRARAVGIDTVKSIIQAAAAAIVLIVGLFDKVIVHQRSAPPWLVKESLALLALSVTSGVLAAASNYFGHYFEAHAEICSDGQYFEEKKRWWDRSNKAYDWALFLGIITGTALLEGLILLIVFWVIAVSFSPSNYSAGIAQW